MDNFADITKDQLEALYSEHSCKAIGSMYGRSAELVRRKLVEFGIERRPSGERKTFNPGPYELNALYQEKSLAEIAKHYGVGETVVWKRIKDYGITLEGFEQGGHRNKTGKVFTQEHKANISHALRGKFGPDSPSWRGGLAEKNLRFRRTADYRDWRKEALARAGFECEQCGAKNGSICECCGHKISLHVHHIESFAKVPERRFDPTNSEVLCPKCHHSRHHGKIG